MFPAPQARVARRFVHLIDRLRPAAAGVGQFQRAFAPTFTALVLHQFPWLVAPVLPPMFGDQGFAHPAVVAHDAHLQDVHQTDAAAVITVHIHPLRTPGLIGPGTRTGPAEARNLQEIEADAETARHGQDGATVTLKGRHIGFTQRLPGVGVGLVQHQGCTVRRAATGCRRIRTHWP